MPGAWTTLSVKDGGGTSRTMRVWDESGIGNGPYSFASTIADLTGAGSVVIKAASTAAAATDESLVTNESPNSQISATTGLTTGAAVVTDVPGTLQQYLRGLVKLLSTGINVVVTNVLGAGRALPGASAPVVLNSMTYKTCLASVSTQMGTTGAAGDYFDGLLIIPGTAAAGVVQIQDAALTPVTIFAGGGTTALPTLAPFYVPIGALATGTGGWKVITNANVTAIGIGNFT